MTVPERDRDELDAVFDVLGDQRRRIAIHVLAEYRQPMSLSDLATDVAARESDASDGDVTIEAVERVQTSLYHSHLPKLADFGVVEFDSERTMVELVDEGSDTLNRFTDAAVVPTSRSTP